MEFSMDLTFSHMHVVLDLYYCLPVTEPSLDSAREKKTAAPRNITALGRTCKTKIVKDMIECPFWLYSM